MPNASTQAFILGSTPYNEQDKLVHMLTKNKGILRAIAPGSLKNRNRFGSILELFTEGEFLYYWTENKNLITLSKGDIINSNFTLVSDPKHIFYFYLISEILLKFIPFNQKDQRIYRLVGTVIKTLSEGSQMNLLLLYFLIWILRIEGMMFNPVLCYNCFSRNISKAWLKGDYRGILCNKCRSGEKVSFSSIDLSFIKWTEKHAPKDLFMWLDKLDTPRLIRVFNKKIEHHGEFKLKSVQYLAEYK
jgi:DNA repair protein RecO (recombination protein O)